MTLLVHAHPHISFHPVRPWLAQAQATASPGGPMAPGVMMHLTEAMALSPRYGKPIRSDFRDLQGASPPRSVSTLAAGACAEPDVSSTSAGMRQTVSASDRRKQTNKDKGVPHVSPQRVSRRIPCRRR